MNVWTIIPLISCLTYIALCAVAIQSIGKNTNRHTNQVFVYYLAVAATWSFTSYMLHYNAYPKLALFWNEALTVALIWTLIAYYHFIRAYTNRRQAYGLYIGYTLLAVLAVLSFKGYIVQYSYIKNGMLYHSLGISIYFIGAVSLAYVAAVILILIRRYRISSDATERNRTMYLMVGWSILVLLTYTNVVPPLDALPLDHVGNLINVMIISYAISHFQLLDIKLIVRRGLTYSILILVLVGVYMSAVFFGYYLMSVEPAISIVILATIAGVVLTLLASPVQHFVQEGIDRLFYRGTYDSRKAIFSFRSKMGNILDLEELANEILPAVTKALHVSHARLLFQDNDSGDFTVQFIFPKDQGGLDGELKFKVDNPIISWLDKKGIPLSIEQISAVPELKGLWQSEKALIAKVKLGLLCPISSRGRLIGVLALGQKHHGSPYSHEDIELVHNMADQAGIVIENAQLYSRATQLANTDWLTGLYNHRSFHEHIEQEIGRSSRFGAVFSLIMMDLDLFKSYNDTCGHLAGDEALKEIGKAIQGSIRSIDLAFRYGGEEFAVILPGTGLENANGVAERVRRAVEIRMSSGIIPLTASFGVASWPLDGVSKEEVIARADAALYRAKELGRNRTCLSSELAKPEVAPIGLEVPDRSRALSTIYALAAAVDAKDHYTYGHSRKVSDFAVALAEAIGLPQKKIAIIRAAGLLHDIGKISIPDEILRKKESLTEAEWSLIKDHPRRGCEILRHVPDLISCLPAVLHHHERFDGGGYPSGLKGDAIPVEARILAIADSYEAIMSQRSRWENPSLQQALSELKRYAGTQFDPELVAAFCKLMEQAAADAPKSLETR